MIRSPLFPRAGPVPHRKHRARTGIVLLPFDPHHVIGQVGGAIMGITGFTIATAR